MTHIIYIAARLIPVMAFCAALNAIAAEPDVQAFRLKITDGKVPAAERTLKVFKGDQVRITVSSNTAGVLHLHGYRLEARLVPGTPAELAFRAHATGRYPLEWHGDGNATQTSAHHGPPMAALEVRPK